MVNVSSSDLPLVGKKQSHHITLGAMFRIQDTSITDFLEGWKKVSRSALPFCGKKNMFEKASFLKGTWMSLKVRKWLGNGL